MNELSELFELLEIGREDRRINGGKWRNIEPCKITSGMRDANEIKQIVSK